MLMYFKLLNALYCDRRAVTAVEYAVVAAAVVGVVVAAFTASAPRSSQDHRGHIRNQLTAPEGQVRSPRRKPPATKAPPR